VKCHKKHRSTARIHCGSYTPLHVTATKEVQQGGAESATDTGMSLGGHWLSALFKCNVADSFFTSKLYIGDVLPLAKSDSDIMSSGVPE
jgi:hypothetical protein